MTPSAVPSLATRVVQKLAAIRPQLRFVGNRYYVLTVLVVLGFIVLVLPSQSIRAELCYETGSDLLVVAYHEPILQGFLAPHGGYRASLARGIAAFTVRGLGATKHYPVVSQMLSILAVGLLTGFLNLHAFRALIASDRVRFLLALALGCGVGSDAGHYTLFNVAYFGAPLLAAVALTRFADVGLGTVVAAAFLVPLLILSKGTFVLFGPIYAIALAVAVRRRCAKSIVIMSLGVLGAGGQAWTMKASREGEDPSRRLGVAFLRAEPAAFRELTASVYGRALPLVVVPPEYRAKAALVGAGLTLVLTGFLAYRRRWSLVALVAMTVGVSAATAGLTVLGNPLWYAGRLQPYCHPVAIANGLFLLTLCASLSAIAGRAATAVVVVVLLTFIGLRPVAFADYWYDGDEHPSQWRVYRFMLASESYMIPCNSDGWSAFRHVTHVGWDTPLVWNGIERMELKTWNAYAPQWPIHAVTADLGADRNAPQPRYILGYDAAGKLVGRGTRITPDRLRHQYYLFPNPVTGVEWRFVADDGTTPAAARAALVRVYARDAGY